MWTAGWGRCNGDAPVLRAVTGAIFSSRSRGLKVRSAEAFQARKFITGRACRMARSGGAASTIESNHGSRLGKQIGGAAAGRGEFSGKARADFECRADHGATAQARFGAGPGEDSPADGEDRESEVSGDAAGCDGRGGSENRARRVRVVVRLSSATASVAQSQN